MRVFPLLFATAAAPRPPSLAVCGSLADSGVTCFACAGGATACDLQAKCVTVGCS